VELFIADNRVLTSVTFASLMILFTNSCKTLNAVV
jgi:hypothetical protein